MTDLQYSQRVIGLQTLTEHAHTLICHAVVVQVQMH